MRTWMNHGRGKKGGSGPFKVCIFRRLFAGKTTCSTGVMNEKNDFQLAYPGPGWQASCFV
jgi:hypothetical protein